MKDKTTSATRDEARDREIAGKIAEGLVQAAIEQHGRTPAGRAAAIIAAAASRDLDPER